jgi:sugar phosphate isomerase/epimerase
MKNILLCDNAEPNQVVPFCNQHGCGIEIQAFYDPALLQNDPSAIERYLELVNPIELRSVHGCFADLSPGSFDVLIQEVTRERFQQSYSVAKQLGATHLVLHHGYVPHTSPPDRWLQRCVIFWKDFLSHRDSSIAIHIENMLEWEPDLLADLVDAVGLPVFDANLDIGHVHCNSRTNHFKWIDRLGHRIGYVHIHDNSGTEDEHLALGAGNIPLKEVLQHLQAVAPGACWAIESRPEVMALSLDWLKDNGFLERHAA